MNQIVNRQIYHEEIKKNGNILFDYFNDYTNLDETKKKCIETILDLKGQKFFYIGATSNLDERLLSHMKEKGMYNMYVLTKTFTKNKTKKLEKKLIERFYKRKKNDNQVYEDENGNIIQGGGGEGIVYDENFIYVLFI